MCFCVSFFFLFDKRRNGRIRKGGIVIIKYRFNIHTDYGMQRRVQCNEAKCQFNRRALILVDYSLSNLTWPIYRFAAIWSSRRLLPLYLLAQVFDNGIICILAVISYHRSWKAQFLSIKRIWNTRVAFPLLCARRHVWFLSTSIFILLTIVTACIAFGLLLLPTQPSRLCHLIWATPMTWTINWN